MTPDAVLVELPGWEGAAWQALDGGKINHAWLVEKNGRKAVLKIDEAPRAAPFNTRHAEAAVQAQAAESGIANRVLHSTETVYLTEYLEGRVLMPADLTDEPTLDQVALALKRLHELPLTGRAFDAINAARQYADRIGNADQEVVQQHLRVIESLPEPSRRCCCHNDLVAANIIATPEIHFLDWEYACDNDPMFDLATIVAHHGLSERHASVLLDAYFDGQGHSRQEHLDRYVEFYLSLLWLWSATTPPA